MERCQPSLLAPLRSLYRVVDVVIACFERYYFRTSISHCEYDYFVLSMFVFHAAVQSIDIILVFHAVI